MSLRVKGRQSRAVKKFQSKAPEQHQLLMGLLAQAGSKLEERESFGIKWKEANRRWEEGFGHKLQQSEKEWTEKRSKKRVTWSKDLLRVRSISPRQPQQSPPYKIVKIQEFSNVNSVNDNMSDMGPDFRIIPIKILDNERQESSMSFPNISPMEHISKFSEMTAMEAGSKRLEDSSDQKNENQIKNLFNKMDCSPELKTIIYRSSSRDSFNSDFGLGSGDRSSLRLDLPKPWQNRDASKVVPPTPKPMFQSPFFRSPSDINALDNNSNPDSNLPEFTTSSVPRWKIDISTITEYSQ